MSGFIVIGLLIAWGLGYTFFKGLAANSARDVKWSAQFFITQTIDDWLKDSYGNPVPWGLSWIKNGDPDEKYLQQITIRFPDRVLENKAFLSRVRSLVIEEMIDYLPKSWNITFEEYDVQEFADKDEA